jgi:MFS family permease
MLEGWQFGAAFSGYIFLVLLIIWIVAVRKDVDSINRAETEATVLDIKEAKETSIFGWLVKIREVRLIMITFACDFAMYAYLATILPYWLMSAGGLTEPEAGVWAAIAFPLFGVIGVALGGFATNLLGKRKPVIVACQIIKLVGLMMACLLVDQSFYFIIIGTILFGIGNGGWMPPMFIIPTELPGTNSARVGGGFSLFLSTGYVFGFIAPIIGGVLTTAFARSSGFVNEVDLINYGYKWSFFVLSLSHILAVVTSVMLKETGPGRQKKLKS